MESKSMKAAGSKRKKVKRESCGDIARRIGGSWPGFMGFWAFLIIPSAIQYWLLFQKGRMSTCIISEANATQLHHRMLNGWQFHELRQECILLYDNPMSDFLDEPFMNQLQNGRPAIINVGPNSLTIRELEFLRLLRGDQPLIRMIFVEPNPEVYENLRKNLDMYGIHEESYQIVEAALCPDNRPRPFFRYKPETGLNELGSNNKTFPMKNYCGILEDKEVLAAAYTFRGMYRNLEKEEPQNFSALIEATDPLIENFTVRCISPRDLLVEAGIRPEEVVYLKMDAEGYDAQLLGLFLDIEGFEPAMLQWEFYVGHDSHRNKENLAEDMKAQLTRTADLHYRTYMKGGDFVAVQTHHIREEL